MTSRHIVQVGERFGRGMVVSIEWGQRVLHSGKTPGKVQRFRLCTLRCDCGTTYQAVAGNLNCGWTRSCGCLQREAASAHMSKLSQARNAARIQVFADYPTTLSQREANKIKRFDPKDPDYKARWYLWLRFHMLLEEYNAKLEAQGGRCAICRKLPGKIKLHVDHDHRCCPGRTGCGKCNRDLLCFTCNGLVGKLERLGVPVLDYMTKWGVPYGSGPDSGVLTSGNLVLERYSAV